MEQERVEWKRKIKKERGRQKRKRKKGNEGVGRKEREREQKKGGSGVLGEIISLSLYTEQRPLFTYATSIGKGEVSRPDLL